MDAVYAAWDPTFYKMFGQQQIPQEGIQNMLPRPNSSWIANNLPLKPVRLP
jgi:hypothetical protein